MPAIQGRTLKQLRQAVGFNLGAIHTGTAYDAGSNTTLISLTFVVEMIVTTVNGLLLQMLVILTTQNLELLAITQHLLTGQPCNNSCLLLQLLVIATRYGMSHTNLRI